MMEEGDVIKNIKGRHWVFIIGFISAIITSIWSPEVSKDIIGLLFFIGIGVAFFR